MNIEAVRQGNTSVVVRVQADTIELANVSDFRNAVESIVTLPQTVILDLASVTFMDSSGLGALLSCMRKLSTAGGNLKIANLAPPVLMLFKVVKMDRAFDIYDSVEAATS